MDCIYNTGGLCYLNNEEVKECLYNGFAVNSVHIDGIEIFRSDKGFIKDLATRN